jgi:hypothetical protein
MFTDTATITSTEKKKRLCNQLLTYPSHHQHKVYCDDQFGSDI